MSFYEQYISYLDLLFKQHSLEDIDYLNVSSLPNGMHSFKLYEIKHTSKEEELDISSRAIIDSGLIDATLYVSPCTAGTDRYDFHISNQRNTNDCMIALLGTLQKHFDITSDAMQEISVLSQMPILPENSGYRSLYFVGVERQDNIPCACKLHFRTRMSVNYKDCFMDEMYLAYITKHLPRQFDAICSATRQALRAGHLFLAGVDCCNGNINKRKLYIRITDIYAVADVIRDISDCSPEYKNFFLKLFDAVNSDGRMFIDAFALCFSDGTLSSINYYLATRSSGNENISC